MCVLVAQLCPTLCDPMDYSPQAPLSMGFFRQEYWSGLPCPPPRDLPEPGIEPRSPALQADSLQSEPPGNPSLSIIVLKMTYFIISFFFFFEKCALIKRQNEILLHGSGNISLSLLFVEVLLGSVVSWIIPFPISLCHNTFNYFRNKVPFLFHFTFSWISIEYDRACHHLMRNGCWAAYNYY